MGNFSRSEKIRKELITEARGSFSVVRQALEDASRENGGQPLNIDDVKARIRLLNELFGDSEWLRPPFLTASNGSPTLGRQAKKNGGTKAAVGYR